MWAGVDVGGSRKGFHAALVTEEALHGLHHAHAPQDLARWLRDHRPRFVAVDSPIATAPNGSSSRRCERRLVAAGICGIRYTPDRVEVERNDYYEWIRNGLALYEELALAGLDAIECFPTASWSRFAGSRGRNPRSSWTRRALSDLGLTDVPARLNQDFRDAIAAAVTARLHDAGATEAFGEIVVPRAT